MPGWDRTLIFLRIATVVALRQNLASLSCLNLLAQEASTLFALLCFSTRRSSAERLRVRHNSRVQSTLGTTVENQQARVGAFYLEDNPSFRRDDIVGILLGIPLRRHWEDTSNRSAVPSFWFCRSGVR